MKKKNNDIVFTISYFFLDCHWWKMHGVIFGDLEGSAWCFKKQKNMGVVGMRNISNVLCRFECHLFCTNIMRT